MPKNYYFITVRKLASFHSRILKSACPRSYYDVLNVPINSSRPEIKRAFIELTKKYHPDGNSHTRDSDEFVRVCEAYKILYRRAPRDQYTQRTHNTRFMDNSYTNKNVHRAWVKYQTLTRSKQFSHNVPNFGRSTIMQKNPLVVISRGVPLLPAGKPFVSASDEVGAVFCFPLTSERMYDHWKSKLYMMAFSLISVLVMFDTIKSRNQFRRSSASFDS